MMFVAFHVASLFIPKVTSLPEWFWEIDIQLSSSAFKIIVPSVVGMSRNKLNALLISSRFL